MRSKSTSVSRLAALLVATALIVAALAGPAGAVPVDNAPVSAAKPHAHHVVMFHGVVAPRGGAVTKSGTDSDVPWLAIGLGALGAAALFLGGAALARSRGEHPRTATLA